MLLFRLGTAWRLSLVAGQYNFSTGHDYLDWSTADGLRAPTLRSLVWASLASTAMASQGAVCARNVSSRTCSSPAQPAVLFPFPP